MKSMQNHVFIFTYNTSHHVIIKLFFALDCSIGLRVYSYKTGVSTYTVVFFSILVQSDMRDLLFISKQSLTSLQ